MLLFGTHNFSPSAFGYPDKGTNSIRMSNWELGVVFPPAVGSARIKASILNRIPYKLGGALEHYDLERDAPHFYEEAL